MVKPGTAMEREVRERMRGGAQMISYEVILGLSLIGPILVYGTLNPATMVTAQHELLWGWLPRWGIFVQPIAFLLFLPAAMAALTAGARCEVVWASK